MFGWLVRTVVGHLLEHQQRVLGKDDFFQEESM